MKRPAILLFLGLGFAFCGCSDPSPRLDTSTDEAMNASIEKMSASLDETKRQELTRSIAVLVAPRLAERTNASSSLYREDAATMSQAELLKPYEGLNADQLIARAKEQPK